MPKMVHVVAWHYNGGAGFDWYHNQSAADRAFEKEKENAREFALDNWTAYRFDFNASSLSPDTITTEIDESLDELSVGTDSRSIDPRGYPESACIGRVRLEE